ncbi:LysR substrate-binding domain-containing protein [Pelagicoccus sp. SDUM812003]|uniref:LysR family transcriptional regulator n=1 Tax=Pelagicoccus sp. SDUM812003 TaxID=3041267 RepID=UPI00280DF4E2|nr:LysR substrate-binding domain-containing protein [Pelagicoccus sp. SDUM812003]MDQ8202848.1 LysR substrate-binding domain-containing protein [Pelagicoccus sp. SDUM812003]
MKLPSHRQVQCFLEVCRDFHFTRAAERLGIPQPPLSRHIKELERLLGVDLFLRQGKSVSLTAAGAVFLKEVYQVPVILARGVEAARRAMAGESELLRIGIVGALLGDSWLSSVEAYRRRFPQVQLSLVELSPSDLIRQVESGELDGAMLGVRPTGIPSGLNAQVFRREPVVVCLPNDHELARRKRLKTLDLEGRAVVSLATAVAPAYRDFLEGLFRRRGLRLGRVTETNAAAAMLSMVVAGCGIAILPESVARLGGARISRVPLAEPKLRLEQVFVYQANPSGPLQHLVTVLREGEAK